MKQDQHVAYYSYHTTKCSQITARYVHLILTFESVDKIMILKQIGPGIHISHKQWKVKNYQQRFWLIFVFVNIYFLLKSSKQTISV